jgi:hypothetical protein
MQNKGTWYPFVFLSVGINVQPRNIYVPSVTIYDQSDIDLLFSSICCIAEWSILYGPIMNSFIADGSHVDSLIQLSLLLVIAGVFAIHNVLLAMGYLMDGGVRFPAGARNFFSTP